MIFIFRKHDDIGLKPNFAISEISLYISVFVLIKFNCI